MQKIKFILVFSLLVVAGHGLAQQNNVIDKVVAQLGDNVVLLSDIQKQKIQALQNKVELTPEMDCIILEDALLSKLMIHQAETDSIMVSDEEVDAEMDFRVRDLEAKMGGRENLETFYKKSVAKIKEEFFTQIKNSLTVTRMEQEITSTVSTSPREIKAFFNKIPKDSLPYINSNIVIGQIVVYPEITVEDKEKIRKELESIREEILKGEAKFSTMASVKSEDPGSAANGGSLGWTSFGKMVPEFEANALALKPGEISPVFESMYGYHIVQLMERKGNDYLARHILMTPKINNDALIRSYYKIEEIKKKLDAGGDWQELTEMYSEDETTAKNSGIIYNPYTNDRRWDVQNINQIDPEIFTVVDQLEVGEISAPNKFSDQAKRKDGFRIVKVLERSEPHTASLETDYQLIQTASLNEKKQAEIQNWVKSNAKAVYLRIEDEFKACPFQYEWTK